MWFRVVRMAPQNKLTTAGVISEAVDIVDRLGYDALSVSAVAAEMAVAPSALYTYCHSLDGLRNLVAVAATNNLTQDVRNAATGTSGEFALNAMASAYREFSHDHPGQFASTLRPPAADNRDLDVANRALLDVFVLVYAAMGLDEDHAWLAATSTRSALHGFLALEHTGGTNPGHADEFGHLLGALIGGLAKA